VVTSSGIAIVSVPPVEAVGGGGVVGVVVGGVVVGGVVGVVVSVVPPHAATTSGAVIIAANRITALLRHLVCVNFFMVITNPPNRFHET